MTALEHAVAGSHVGQPPTRIGADFRSHWTRGYIRRLAFTDVVAIVVSVVAGRLVRFGADPATLRSEVLVYSYTAVSAVLILAWFSSLILFRSREPRVLGTGVEEYRRVARASATLHGEPFTMLKFRTMVVDAEQHRLVLLSRNEGAGPLFKMRRDPRITKVGRWLRRLSIDEAPHLITVLLGQMSLVGPRPPLRSEVPSLFSKSHLALVISEGD